MRSSRKFSFGYHPVTGKHKVVNIPCLRDLAAFKAVQVFTLGDDKAWREVPVLVQGSCNLSSEPLSLNGRTYWLTESFDRVMALDLNDERVTSFTVPSVKQTGPIPAGAKWQLTNAHGNLGVVVSAAHPYEAAWERVGVWVREGGGEQLQWSPTHSLTTTTRNFWMVAPQLAYSGGCILSASRVEKYFYFYSRWLTSLYRHKGSNSTDDRRKERTTEKTELIMSMDEKKRPNHHFCIHGDSRASAQTP
ncbi:hypothetical protein PR202_gb02812 [Eleusine coracana subsp. coracana]|uniref:F-box associated beta-propeller type 3 domain-containing protein n=1 Tax=Eleusine coracana subsp. coracana TaxID=191504 RepID=A0AAV5E094_ELECO|nr:hypothetical protein PR202_gb02812 [Eleusine coracana subsp. coracana]